MSLFESFKQPTAPANFTPRAQQVLALSRQEAERLSHNFVGTEHLLLGLIRLGQGTAVNVLEKFDLNLEAVRMEVENHVCRGLNQKQMFVNIPYTPRVKKVLSLAAKEAKALNHTYVGTEHILLGLLSEGDGIAAGVLKNFEVDIAQTRMNILKELDPNFRPENLKTPAESPAHLLAASDPDSIDTGKRYDIYCHENIQNAVVYRNALFKGRKKLMSAREHGFMSEYLEVEQSNGQTIYLSRHSVVKFCETGSESTGKIVD